MAAEGGGPTQETHSPLTGQNCSNRHLRRPSTQQPTQDGQGGSKQDTAAQAAHEQRQQMREATAEEDDRHNEGGAIAEAEAPHASGGVVPGSKQDTADRARYEERLAAEATQRPGSTLKELRAPSPRGAPAPKPSRKSSTITEDGSETHWSSSDHSSSSQSGGPQEQDDVGLGRKRIGVVWTDLR